MQNDPKPWPSLTHMDKMHLAMCVAHGLGGIVIISMALPCDVAQANQRAMLPATIPIDLSTLNISAVRAHLAAFPWSEDNYFATHVWNPYILIAAFEWLTAAFALCNLWHLTRHIQLVTLGWMGVGAALVAMWFLFNTRRTTDTCTAMAVTLAVSYAAGTWLCLSSLSERGEQSEEHAQLLTPPVDKPPEHEEYQEDPQGPAQEQALTVRSRLVVEQGRTWRVPRKMAALKKHRLEGITEADGAGGGSECRLAFRRAMDEISFRYIEYCITAPLLFLAVMCLLTVDAPAWLFLAGYWMIQACNAIGIAFHYSICFEIWYAQEEPRPPAGSNKQGEEGKGGSHFGNLVKSFLAWTRNLVLKGGWQDRWVHHLSLLNNAWLCLLFPIGGLVYMSRSWLLSFSTDMPWLAIVMIWQLLLTYCMFGIIPTAIYLSGRCDWIQKLPWCLDVLNLAAKWPLPIFILIAFSTRPAGFHMCAG